MVVKTTQPANLCHGKNRQKNIAQNVVALWWKREVNFSVQMKNVVTKLMQNN